MRRRSYSDPKEQAARFDVGDRVKVLNERTGKPSRWVGTVTDIDDVTGTVAVSVPFADTLRHRAEILVQADANETPPQADNEVEASRDVSARVSKTYQRTVMGRLRKAASDLKRQGVREVDAFGRLSKRLSHAFSDAEMKYAIRCEFTSLNERVAKDLSKLSAQDPSVQSTVADLLGKLD